jgi:energy-coupling factor transport system ATP-binding protein
MLRELASDGVGVVHVTHYPNEASAADRTIHLDHGRVVTSPDTPPLASSARPARARIANSWATGRALMELHGIGHVYSRGTPWAKRALEGVDLTIGEGDALLVVGHNGSGKSTLAWIIAGLLRPSEGTALVAGEPIADHIGRVGISFQHARLQLLRPNVGDDVMAAAGVKEWDARRALTEVGLPADISDRRVDELSGGQMRRVVLAAVVAARSRAMVLDEPFAGLDADGRAELEGLLVRVRERHSVALVIVSHDRDLPAGLVDRVVELDRGRIVRDAPAADDAEVGGAQ